MAIHIIGISGKKQHGKNTVAEIIQELTSPLSDTFTNSVGKWKQKSFATKLKQIGALLLNVDPKKFEDEEYKNTELWVNPESGESVTPRLILQKIGTELGRGLHPDLWVNTSFADYKRIKREVDDSEEYIFPNWIFTDVRFPNEANAIVERGGIMLRVFRPGKLRVWYQDPDQITEGDEQDSSGYYYVQSIEGDIWSLSNYADGMGSQVEAFKHEIVFDGSDGHPSETALDDYVFDELIINDGDKDSLKNKIKSILEKHKIL